MKRNCNLELRLVTPSASFHFSDHNSISRQQMTIFYDGKVASCDATEQQARAIISSASREVEEKSRKKSPPETEMKSPAYSAVSVTSMKRSLQRFLENRKSRVQAMSPFPMIRK